jgi:hypothetical protein
MASNGSGSCLAWVAVSPPPNCASCRPCGGRPPWLPPCSTRLHGWPTTSLLRSTVLRPGWRNTVLAVEKANRRTWEVATLLALRDRLRAGDIWVEGSRQGRSVEDQLIKPALFQNMREAGPLPVAVPENACTWLAERRDLLARGLTEVDDRAARGALEDVRIEGEKLTITPQSQYARSCRGVR